jgi:hypothetical protein
MTRTTFPIVLKRMVMDPEFKEAICFSDDGTYVMINKTKNDVLIQAMGRHFKHSNYSSLTRQFDNYSFTKKVDPATGFLFVSHPNFRRDSTRQELELIQRNKRTNVARLKPLSTTTTTTTMPPLDSIQPQFSASFVECQTGIEQTRGMANEMLDQMGTIMDVLSKMNTVVEELASGYHTQAQELSNIRTVVDELASGYHTHTQLLERIHLAVQQ